MALFFTSLNSGSNGNCYYIGNESEAVLIDAGISCREVEKRMRNLGLNIHVVKAIFITHEHTDHISGLASLVKKYNFPVYISNVRYNSSFVLKEESLKTFKAHIPVDIGSLVITAFPKFHDGIDPHSFIITCNNISVGVFTDTGRVCKNTIKYFGQCHAAFLETNYDEEMLEKGSYPVFLKKRISSGYGHLSNVQALNIFNAYRPDFMSHLILSHLSKNNNTPQIVESVFSNYAGNVKIVVASREKETEVYCINKSNAETIKINNSPQSYSQLKLSFA